MAITRQQALTESEFHWERPGNRNGCEKWRRNGATKTWKTRPDEFRIPVKHGLRDHGYITEAIAAQESLHLASECPLD